MPPPRKRRKEQAMPDVHPRRADFGAIECGACLLPLIDSSETELSKELHNTAFLEFASLDVCDHLFHQNCLEIWAARDTSCPLCRYRFNLIGLYDSEGKWVKETKVTPVYLAEVLELEEEEGDDGDEDAAVEEDDLVVEWQPFSGRRQAPRRRPQRVDTVERRQRIERMRQDIDEANRKLQEKLADERNREIARLKRIQANVDPEHVKLSILKNLKRLPYNSQTDPSPQQQSRSPVVPNIIRPKAAVQFRLSRRPGGKPASYEQDFLMSSSSNRSG